MENKFVKVFSALMCAFALLLSLFSCADADIVIYRDGDTKVQGTEHTQLKEIFALTVNISTGTFHLSEDCRYAAKTKEENKKIILYSDVQTAIEDGYKPCSVCAEEYKN